MRDSNIKKFLFKICSMFMFIFVIGFAVVGINVNAEGEIRIIREEKGDLERLEAVEIPDECTEEWQETESIQCTQNRASSSANAFLEYSSDYGYQDMAKRSNSEARQYAYQQLKALSKNFTVNGQNAAEKTYGQNTFAVAGSIDLSAYHLTSDEMVEIYFTFRHDNPQFFWLSNRIAYGSKSLTVLTYDAYENGTVRQVALEEIVQTAQTIYQSQISDTDSNYQKILKIHDALIADIEYSADTSIPTAHSIAGAMTSGKSVVCEGYAKVMQVMMNQYGIMNIYVTGTANGGGHAWNMVRMDGGEYYWLDATWDDQPYEQFQHQYFLVGNQNFTNHTIDLSTSTGTGFLYEVPRVSEEDYVYDPSGNETGNIADKIAEIKVKMRPYNEDTVKASDKEILEKLAGDIHELLETEGISENEVAELIQLKDICEKLLEWITENFVLGDVNEDGTVNIKDLQIILRSVCGKIELTDRQKMLADVVTDGSINIEDLQKVLRFVCGKVTEL